MNFGCSKIPRFQVPRSNAEMQNPESNSNAHPKPAATANDCPISIQANGHPGERIHHWPCSGFLDLISDLPKPYGYMRGFMHLDLGILELGILEHPPGYNETRRQ
jgi:hypothetical protein